MMEHRALLAIELEVLAKKLDKFGWERDRNSHVQDRIIVDFMDALQDYPIDEVRAACKAAVIALPDKMPNEGHVRRQVQMARRAAADKYKHANPRKAEPASDPRVTAEAANAILRKAGLGGVKPKTFGDLQD